MGPDARGQARSSWLYREALMALMLERSLTPREAGELLGIPYRSIHRYLKLTRSNVRKARPMQYPQRYLIEQMLSPETRRRLTQATPIVNS